MFKKCLLFSLLLFCIWFFAHTPVSLAQTPIESGDLFFEIAPEIPEPGQLVKVRLGSYVFSVDELYVEWIEDGQVKLSGNGEKNFKFTAGAIGETKLVTLIVKDKPGGSILFRKNIVSKPSGLDILWQAVDSYTPPFYKGKALPTSEGVVKIIALPTFQVGTKNVLPKDVIYSWKRNYNPIVQASGYGRNSISIKQSFLVDEEKISVVANEPNEGGTAQASLLIKPYTPKIVFYAKDPLMGIDFHNGVDEATRLGENDVTVVAIPYFVSPKNILDPDLLYTWKLNDSLITTPNIKNQIILRGASTGGAATLELNIESAKKLFLTVKNKILLEL
jgi:hypothetical protein